MRFDALSANALKDRESMVIDDCPGLRLRASASTRTWLYRYKSPIDEKMRQIKIGNWPSMSLTKASVEWDRLKTLRSQGTDPVLGVKADKVLAEAKRREVVYTVRRLCNDYLAGHVDLHRKPDGAKRIRRIVTLHSASIGEKRADTITRSDAFDLVESLLATPVIAIKFKCEMGAAWDHALDAGRIPAGTPNWWRQVMKLKIRSRGKTRVGKNVGVIKRVLSETEVVKLIKWLPNVSELVSDVLQMYLWTGTRGAEILAIESSEITHEKDGWWWTCPKIKTKNKNRDGAGDLRVPLVGRALEIVQKRQQRVQGGWLFPALLSDGHSEQEVISQQVFKRQPYASNVVNQGSLRWPVTHWAPHDLRRTTRTLLSSIECPDVVAEVILGHMQGPYDRHGYDKQRRVWLTKLDAHLECLLSV